MSNPHSRNRFEPVTGNQAVTSEVIAARASPLLSPLHPLVLLIILIRGKRFGCASCHRWQWLRRAGGLYPPASKGHGPVPFIRSQRDQNLKLRNWENR